MNKKAILKFGIIIIIGVVLASATISAGVLADAPAESAYSDILNDTEGEGTSSNPHVVTTVDELQAVQGNLSAEYILGNNINASETEMWNSGAGFKPIGDALDPFSGNFNGQGFSVYGLSINRPNTYRVGLFGKVNSADIKNIGVTNIDIQGRYRVGGLVGYTKGANIINSFSSGEVSGEDQVGGLVGTNKNTKIETSYSNSNVSGDLSVGGLVGLNKNTTIKKSYSNSSVTGDEYVGGLVGENRLSSNILRTYSTGSVTGEYDVGGLVGSNDEYSTVADSYWNTETSTQATSAGSAIGLTTADMTGSAASTKMVGFDFTSVWSTVSASDADSSADSYPILASVDSVIVSESSSEEYGGMSTLVSVALFFLIFIMVLLLLVKD
jgi:hypothetical protein